MRRRLRWALALAVAVSTATAVLVGLGLEASANPGTVLKFETMAAVSGPYVGATNPIRGVPGGGLPWIISGATGRLDADGSLTVHVRGLVLAERAPVPPNLQGTNPVPDFKGVVSCQSVSNGQAVVTNVSTGLFPASTSGDSHIDAQVALPKPCFAPIIFVTSPTGAWFATTGA
jgi:hypothetical protein